jgi:hypothetical protein
MTRAQLDRTATELGIEHPDNFLIGDLRLSVIVRTRLTMSILDPQFPIIDRTTAIQAMRAARTSIREAPGNGFGESQIEEAKEEFRRHWRRRIDALGLTQDQPDDPFA